MYLRTISRRNKDGSQVRYVQLAHNVRHPESGNAVAQVLHSFGREDQLDRDALARLVRSLSRYLGEPPPELPAGVGAAESSGELAFVSSRTLGGPWLLDGLWRRLGFDELVRGCLRGRRQRTELTAGQRDILRALDVAEPPRFLHLNTSQD
jgi:hypothetical protein